MLFKGSSCKKTNIGPPKGFVQRAKNQALDQNSIFQNWRYVDHDIAEGKVDVIVTDCFSGNIAIKTAEGTAKLFSTFLKNSFNKGYFQNIDIVIVENQIGEIIHINIISTHGLAFKKEYLDSWRSNKNPNNILDSLGIHYLDLILYNLGDIKNADYFPCLVSKNGNSYDTCTLTLKTEKTSTMIYCSYANPKINEIIVIGTNGYLTIRDNKKEVFSPRDCFDEKGFFIKPPAIQSDTFDFDVEYIESLKNSLKYFLDCVANKKSIDIENFEKSMITTRMLIELKH